MKFAENMKSYIIRKNRHWQEGLCPWKMMPMLENPYTNYSNTLNFVGHGVRNSGQMYGVTVIVIIFFNTVFVSSHMYPENPEGTQVIVGSMNMGYISDTARNRTHNLFRPKREPIPLGHSAHFPRLIVGWTAASQAIR